MDEARKQKIDECVSRAARAMDEANELVKEALFEEIREVYPTAAQVILELEDDDGTQWYGIVSINDKHGKDLTPDLADGSDDYDKVMEPLHELASELFVTPDFGASWIDLTLPLTEKEVTT